MESEKVNLYKEASKLATEVVKGNKTLEEFDAFVNKNKNNKPKMFTMHCDDLRRYILNKLYSEVE